eukprot:c22565_g7_i1 orf=1-510(-)
MGNCMGIQSDHRWERQDEYSNCANAGGNHFPSSHHASSSAGHHVSNPRYSSSSTVGEVLNRPMEDVKTIYDMGRELGRGQFGITYLCTSKSTGEKSSRKTYLCTNKSTGETLACKSILKAKLTTKDDIEDVRREVQIMHHLAGHPNIVELKGAYEDKQYVHLVMELCEGG